MKVYNKILAAALCLCLVLGCLGMAACAEGAGTANPGTYTASAVGKNGDVTLTVTYSENAITDVQVEEAETPTIGGAAIEAMTAQVLAEQTLTPDAVSGATETGRAYLAALAETAAQAGAEGFGAPAAEAAPASSCWRNPAWWAATPSAPSRASTPPIPLSRRSWAWNLPRKSF